VLVGFAAEHGEGAVAYGREKLTRKGLDAVVVNDVGVPGIGFDSTDNEVTIVTGEAELQVSQRAKSDVAGVILDAALSRRSQTASNLPR
jgi:phosphopantothenoylcysteine decarboxylase/phosphopantothenate--cysteine ligase